MPITEVTKEEAEKLAKEQVKKELGKLAEESKSILVSINDPAIDTIQGDFILGNLLNLIAASIQV